ncbi:acrylate utilization transcriptional regulator AcuR [Komagataeibacter europaeus]|uniref:acrylate utilization transcriptional regulator AcuR n=2 Tax=Komagataeibacter europaeus TaxID=33995 RepID=UPI001FC939CE|nr:TetR/AcrR family transcriptional regulator [Komagataeibacter europaeus]
MPNTLPPRRGRGRPPKIARAPEGTRAMLVRAGVGLLTEKGFSSTCVDDVLNATGISKGSFYYCFNSKEDFGQVLIDSYATYFNAKMDLWLTDRATPPLQRMLNFMQDARAGMMRHHFRRGCLIGNLGQEIDMLPDSFNGLLLTILEGWERRVTDCLLAACGPNPTAAQRRLCSRLSRYFWIGWEGAVLRARMEHDAEPLDLFATFFLAQAAAELGTKAPVVTTLPGSPVPPAPGQTAQAAN